MFIARIVTIITLALLALGEACSAQEQTVEFTNFHTWTDVSSIVRIRDGFYYDGDYGVRGLLTDARLEDVRLVEDLAGIERVAVARTGAN